MAGSVLVLFFAEEIVTLIGGPEFMPTALPLRLLVAAISAEGLSLILRFAAIARGQQKKMLAVDVVAAVVAAAAFLLLIPKFSYTGAAVGKFLANAAILVGAAAVSMNRDVWRRVVRPGMELLVAGALMAITIAWSTTNGAYWLVSSLVGLVVFGLALLPMRGLRRSLASLTADSQTGHYT